jgi:phosphate starvation-inducible PhoH-like protein
LGFIIKKRFTASQESILKIFGPRYKNRKRLEEELGVKILIRNNKISLDCDSANRLKKAQALFSRLLNHRVVHPENRPAHPSAGEGRSPALEDQSYLNTIVACGRRSNIFLKSRGQERFYNAVQANDLVFVIGPAGTGKTYLAVAMAVASLKKRQTERIVLVRPAVEAGENLGFLPGNLREKIDPYLAPLYDALYDILPREAVKKHFEDRTIEVSPLAYMRGRTLNNAFIILDEAQNATLAQMKMFLTRLGIGSKAIVAGDITQIDLEIKHSGLLSMKKVLQGVENTGFVYLDSSDVVRHQLVRNIIDAYEAFERKNGG